MDTFPLIPAVTGADADTAVSTGFPNVDEMLGVGGLPRGKVVEVYGGPECGKTTLALHWAAAAQEQGATVVYVDAERKLRPGWAVECGVNVEELLLVNPDTGTQAVQMLETLLRSFTVDLAIVDSAAALVGDEELAASLEDMPMDLHSDFLMQSLRRLGNLAERGRCCLVMLNQSRRHGDGMERGSGGRALGMHAAIRVQVERGSGSIVSLLTVKNKLGEPFQEAVLYREGARLVMAERKRPDGARGRGRRRMVGAG